MKDSGHSAIATILRVGVLSSLAVMLIGMAVTFIRHPEYFAKSPTLGTLTSPNAHFPNTLVDVASGVAHGHGQAIVMAGLLLLIATPVARVALSAYVFVKVRDRLYAAITFAVLVILLISFGVGRVGG